MISTRMRNSTLHCDNEVIDEVLKPNTLPHTLQFCYAPCERQEVKRRIQQICGAVSTRCGIQVSDGRAMVRAVPVRATTWNVGLCRATFQYKSGCQVKCDCQLAVGDGCCFVVVVVASRRCNGARFIAVIWLCVFVIYNLCCCCRDFRCCFCWFYAVSVSA